METYEESQHSYPEEAPVGSDPTGGRRRSEDAPQRQGARAGGDHEHEAGLRDEGTAPWNPHAAGAGEEGAPTGDPPSTG